MMLRTPVCSYPIIVSHLSFNFLCLLLLYSIYLNGIPPSPELIQWICGSILGIYCINRLQTHKCGNWDLAAQFPEKEFINDIFVAVCTSVLQQSSFYGEWSHYCTYFSYARTFFTAITVLVYRILHILSIEIELARRQYNVFLVCVYIQLTRFATGLEASKINKVNIFTSTDILYVQEEHISADLQKVNPDV